MKLTRGGNGRMGIRYRGRIGFPLRVTVRTTPRADGQQEREKDAGKVSAVRALAVQDIRKVYCPIEKTTTFSVKT